MCVCVCTYAHKLLKQHLEMSEQFSTPVKNQKAETCVKEGKFEEAALLYRQIGLYLAQNPFLKFRAPVNHMRCGLCLLASRGSLYVRTYVDDVKKWDDPASPKIEFLERIAEIVKAKDLPAFTATVQAKDKQDPLDACETAILLEIKKKWLL